MAIKIDCIFRLNDKKCEILTKKQCSRCHFMLSKKERDEKKSKADLLLRRRVTPENLQKIIEKYYSEN